jgi:hypothetical protein
MSPLTTDADRPGRSDRVHRVHRADRFYRSERAGAVGGIAFTAPEAGGGPEAAQPAAV